MPADRRDLRKRLFALAAEQAGYFTAAQAMHVGYSYQAQAHHLSAGNWERVDRGLFRLAEWIPDLNDDLARWTVWSKGLAVVSHESALAVYELGEFESSRLQLTVPNGFSRRNDAVILHHADLPDSDVRQRVGFRITTPARSIIDVAALSPSEDQLVRAIDDALRAGLLTFRSLTSRAEMVDLLAALNIERAFHRRESA